MISLYQDALNGTLVSTQADVFGCAFTNHFPFPIDIFWINGIGGHNLTGSSVTTGQSVDFSDSHIGDCFLFQCAMSGGFVGTIRITGQVYDFILSSKWCVLPNDIGEIPQPRSDRLIPPDTALVMIASGTTPNGNIITREQYWARQPDSFSLAAGESKTSSTSVSRGLQQTSSSTKTVAGALGVDAGAGWGPISASVSASLNASASFFQQVTVSEETTVYESKTFENTQDYAALFLAWQLTDVITIYNGSDFSPLATMSSGEAPTIVQGPYNPMDMTASIQAFVPEPAQPKTALVAPQFVVK